MRHTSNTQARKIKIVEDAMDRDNFMSAEEAKSWGLIDHVVESKPVKDDKKDDDKKDGKK